MHLRTHSVLRPGTRATTCHPTAHTLLILASPRLAAPCPSLFSSYPHIHFLFPFSSPFWLRLEPKNVRIAKGKSGRVLLCRSSCAAKVKEPSLLSITMKAGASCLSILQALPSAPLSTMHKAVSNEGTDI